MSLIALQLEGILGELVEVGDRGIHPQLGSLEGFPADDLLHHGDVAVIDMGVGDDVDQLPRLQAGDLGEHHQEGGVLHHVPAVGGEHILTSLVQNAVQNIPRHIEGHGVGAGLKGHVLQVMVVEKVGDHPPGGGAVLQGMEDPVHLIHPPFGKVIFYP